MVTRLVFLSTVVGLAAAMVGFGTWLGVGGGDEIAADPNPELLFGTPEPLIAEILADGELTETEMDAATDATIACLRDLGAQVTMFADRDWRGFREYAFSFPLFNDRPSQEWPEDVTAAAHGCHERFSFPVQSFWSRQQHDALDLTDDDDARAEALREFARNDDAGYQAWLSEAVDACLVDMGEIEPGETASDLIERRRAESGRMATAPEISDCRYQIHLGRYLIPLP